MSALWGAVTGEGSGRSDPGRVGDRSPAEDGAARHGSGAPYFDAVVLPRCARPDVRSSLSGRSVVPRRRS